MHIKPLNLLLYPHLYLLVIFAFILTIHISNNDDLVTDLAPESIYQFNLSMFFETDNDVEIATYLPLESGRQSILDETIVAKNLNMEDKSGIDGRYVEWYGTQQSQQIHYEFPKMKK